jgi:hypothetical protein
MALDLGLTQSGAKSTRGPYFDGQAGVRQSIEAMAQKMREGKVDPRVIGWTGKVLKEAGLDGRGPNSRSNTRAQAAALLDAFRADVVYTPDPYGTELISSAAATLCLSPGLCLNRGDCDDSVVALGSATLSLAIPTVIVKQSFGVENQEHVLMAVQDETGDWIYADPSTNLPLGRAPNAVEEIWVDPMQPIGNLGEAGAEIITLGAPLMKQRHVRLLDGYWWEEREGRAFVHADGEWHDTGLGHIPVGVGTNIFGYPTVSDLKDLIDAAAYFLQQVQAAAAACTGWPDASAWTIWQADLLQVQAKFNEATALTNEILTGTPKWLLNIRIASGYDGGWAWERVREVIRDITDLDRRFRAANACTPPTYDHMPQPQTPDTQLQVYKSADALVKGVEQIGTKLIEPTTIGVGGVLIGCVLTVGGLLLVDHLLPHRR